MIHTVVCPHCNRKLGLDEQHLGTAVLCPMCKNTFVPPAGPPAVPPIPATPPPLEQAPYPVQSPLPRPPQPPPPRRPATSALDDLLDQYGYDLDEEHDPAVSGSNEADRRLAEWKEEMPEVPSAYQPSGKLPAGAIVAMLGGSVAGAFGGALAFVVLAALTVALLFAGAWFLDWMAATCGRVLCILIILEILLGVVGFAIAFGVQGWLSAVITTAAGQMGKNRNAGAAAFFSVGSCLMGLLLSFVGIIILAYLIPPGGAQGGQQQGGGEWWVGWVAWGGSALGALLALALAGFTGHSKVSESKFCEDCEEYMQDEKRRGLRLGTTKAVVRAMTEGQVDAVAELLDSREGKDAVPTLFHCAKCSKGYFEVQAKFECTWKGSENNEEKKVAWLAASMELDPAQVERFQKRGRRRSRRDEDEDDI